MSLSIERGPTVRSSCSRRVALAIAGSLALLGVVVFLAAQTVPWGPPGTSRYETYALMNRLVGLPWSVVVLILALQLREPRRLGLAVAILGAALIVLGTWAEFWWLTETSYRDPARATAWTLFMLGHPVFVIGYVVAWWQVRAPLEGRHR